MSTNNPRVLIFSQRNSSRRPPFRCAHFEFENTIAEIDSAEIVSPEMQLSTRKAVFAKQLAYHTPFLLNPGIKRPVFQHKYDLFFAICGDPSDLLMICNFGDWRKTCRRAVCVIDEVWVRQMPDYKNYLKLLRNFDLVCLYYTQSVEPLNKIIGPRSMYLPPAVDTIKFSPYPHLPERVVDIYSIGRRAPATHESLVKWTAKDSRYYIYDTTSADRVLDPDQHRQLYANTLKRSRYFIVNPGLIDRPDTRGNQIEIGYRYFDGIAAGAINVGLRAENDVFAGLFDWPNAIVDLPYNSTAFQNAVAELEQNPEAVEQMRRNNVRQALLRHDWVYRWETILKTLEMAPLPQIEDRKARIKELAKLSTLSGGPQTFSSNDVTEHKA